MKVRKTVAAGAGDRAATVRGRKEWYAMKRRRARRMKFMGVAIVWLLPLTLWARQADMEGTYTSGDGVGFAASCKG